MTGKEIKIALIEAEVTQTEIARRRNVSVAMVNRVIWQGDVSDHVRREIARAIGKNVAEVWPDYYQNSSG